MLGAEIPDGYLIAVAPIFVTSVLGLLAWIVREMFRTTARLDALDARDREREKDLGDHEQRIRHLEGVG